MPIRMKGQSEPGPADAPAPRSGLRLKGEVVDRGYDPQITDTDDGVDPLPQTDGLSTGAAAVGGLAAVGGAAWLLSKLKNAPGLLGKVGKGAEYVNSARQQLMLSGLALPKSMLGNAGAAVSASMERGSMQPLKQMFSGQTLKDAVSAYKNNTGAVGASANAPRGVTIPFIPTPGRIMGAFDEAAQKALQRGGLTAKEAEREVLQAPLQGQLAEALDSPLARYVHPFRRTPFNQFIEGWKSAPFTKHAAQYPKTVGAYTAAGAAHGGLTADDDTPVSIPMVMAAAGKYGLTYGAAAMIARALAEGKISGSGIASGMLPVSEYGVEQSITSPLQPFEKPAALTALERLSR